VEEVRAAKGDAVNCEDTVVVVVSSSKTCVIATNDFGATLR